MNEGMNVNLEQISKPKFEYKWLDDQIIYFKYDDNAVVQLDDVVQMLKLQAELGINENTKRIVHAGRYTTITTNARKYVEKNKPIAFAEAYILTNLPQRLLFNIYSKFRSTANPINSFDNLESALKWLNNLKEPINKSTSHHKH